MKYHNITYDDMRNGMGLRVTLWVSGCAHACKGCQNPITWNPDEGLEFDSSAKDEIFGQLSKDYISGITFSGGDPLFTGNRKAVFDLIKEIKDRFPTKNIWLYTGYTWEEINTLENIDLIDVIVDGPFVEKSKDYKLKWRGSSNQRVMDVHKSLKNQSLELLCD